MLELYSYWRSSASYRVRVALNLKALPYVLHAVNLAKGGGEQFSPAYRAVNPQSACPRWFTTAAIHAVAVHHRISR
jgi:glutathione S-transferase